jgi:ubiquinone/menaquinone biosynthesis C-methylase UbiE
MKFSDEDSFRIKKFYSDLIDKHGSNNPYSLNWSSEYNQIIRFAILSQVGLFENKSILDVGCGLGHLHAHLKKVCKNFSYTGIDIVPKMISEAKKKYPDVDFRAVDFNEFECPQYDFILSSGALSFKIKNWEKIYLEMIKRMFKYARLGIAFNALDKTKHVDDETFAAYSPTKIYEFCASLTEKLILRHDYLPHDFTVYLYK